MQATQVPFPIPYIDPCSPPGVITDYNDYRKNIKWESIDGEAQE